MHPILLKLGPITIHTYGALLALGAALGLWLLNRLARKSGLDPEKMGTLAIWILISGLAGSRIAFVVIEYQHYASNPLRMFYIWDGGLVFYGGVAAALILGMWLARRWRIPLLPTLDCAGPALALGQAIGRFGCFSAGCCYGQPCEGWCAVVFRDPHTLAPPGVALHPTQLYTAGALLIILGILLWFWPRRRFPGQIFFSYGLLHGIARLIIEQFRGDWRGEPLMPGLTPTGAFALALAVFSAIMLVYLAVKSTQEKGHHGVSPGS
jgi:phosphatidylglycerol:prolipoprotein diacylglycerol transferase